MVKNTLMLMWAICLMATSMPTGISWGDPAFRENWDAGWINPAKWRIQQGPGTLLDVEDISGNGSDYALVMWPVEYGNVWTVSLRTRFEFERASTATMTALIWGDPSRTDGTYTYPNGMGWNLGFHHEQGDPTAIFQDLEAVMDDWYGPAFGNTRLRFCQPPDKSAFEGDPDAPQLSIAYMTALMTATSKSTAMKVRIALGATVGASFEWFDPSTQSWIEEVNTIGLSGGTSETASLGFGPTAACVFIDDIEVTGVAVLSEDWESGTIDSNLWAARSSAGGSQLQVEDISGDGSDHALVLWNGPINGWRAATKSLLGFTRASGTELTFRLWGDPARTDGFHAYPLGMGGPNGFHRDSSEGHIGAFEDLEAGLDHWYTTEYGNTSHLVFTQWPDLSTFQGGTVDPTVSTDFMDAMKAATSKADSVLIRITLGSDIGARLEWYDTDSSTWVPEVDTIGVSGGETDAVSIGFAAASACMLIDDIVVRGAVSDTYDGIPPEYPRIRFEGRERESRLLTNYYWHHYDNRLSGMGVDQTLFNKEYMTQSDMWADGMLDFLRQGRTQDNYRAALLAMGFDDDGYVYTNQHYSHSHEWGWPFPLWTQVPDGPEGVTVGWHFPDDGQGWVYPYLQGWGNPNYLGHSATNGWSFENLSSVSADGSAWHVQAEGASPVLTPPGSPDADVNWAGAQWVWYPEGDPATGAPVGTRYLRTTFTIPPEKTLVRGRFVATGDNRFVAYANGTAIGLGNTWTQGCVLEITDLLTTGTNCVAVAASNDGDSSNPAGFIGKIYLDYATGPPTLIGTDATWKAQNTEESGWETTSHNDAAWPTALAMGGIGSGPWSTNVVFPEMGIDAFNAPFLQLRYTRTGFHPPGVQPYIEWMRDEDTTFDASRRVYYDYGNGNPGYEAVSGVEHSLVEMFTHPLWEGKIKRLRFALAPGESGIDFIIDSVFTCYDTRHTINNPIFIMASWNYYRWTGDLDFLEANIDRMRTALHHQRDEMGGLALDGIVNPWWGHGGRPGFDAGDPKTFYPGQGIGSNYWDLLPFGGYDTYATNHYYRATQVMADIEEAILAHPEWGFPASGLAFSPTSLRSHAAAVQAQAQSLLWDSSTGRFVACIDTDSQPHDYGFTFLNLDAIWYGIAGPTHARSIMDWISGARTVAGDTSTGADIYRWRFGPRATTLRNIGWYAFPWSGPETIPWGGQVQDGGGVLGFTFYDLWARLQVYGADNAWDRLEGILDWEEDIWEWGGYRNYYDNHEGTLQGGGTAGGLGVDFEFYESSLPPSFVPLGFLGLEPNATHLVMRPRLPSQCGSITIENMLYRGTSLDLTAGDGYVAVRIKSEPPEPIRIELDGRWDLVGTGQRGSSFTFSAVGDYRLNTVTAPGQWVLR